MIFLSLYTLARGILFSTLPLIGAPAETAIPLFTYNGIGIQDYMHPLPYRKVRAPSRVTQFIGKNAIAMPTGIFRLYP